MFEPELVKVALGAGDGGGVSPVNTNNGIRNKISGLLFQIKSNLLH